MKTQKTVVAKKQKEVTLLQLSKELNKLKNEIKSIKEESIDFGIHLETVYFKMRKDVPVIFKNNSGDEIFTTFNLNSIPRVGEKMNLRPSPESCCLNRYLMKEFDLSEEQLTNHVLEHKTHFSFIVSDVATNIFVLDSHPEDEWDDRNCVNFEEEYHMAYIVTLSPNNVSKKEVLIEKIKN